MVDVDEGGRRLVSKRKLHLSLDMLLVDGLVELHCSVSASVR